MTEIPDLGALMQPDPETQQDDTPSMRAVVFLQDPTEAIELDLVNLEGMVIGMRVDGSELIYLPWRRVKEIAVPRSQPSTEAHDA